MFPEVLKMGQFFAGRLLYDIALFQLFGDASLRARCVEIQ